MSTTAFQTEKYRFEFVQEREFVLIKIKLVEPLAHRRDITDEDVKEIENFLDDVGKWETLVKTGINLLSDLEIVQISEETKRYHQREFGAEKYRIEVRKSSNWHIDATIELSREERHRRGDREVQLPVDEVFKQIQNIPKWKSFIKASRLLRQT